LDGTAIQERGRIRKVKGTRRRRGTRSKRRRIIRNHFISADIVLNNVCLALSM